MDLILVFPGQGSQKVGMARDLADAFPAARAVLDTVDAALGAPLTPLMFEGPAEELTLTHNAQPALLAHSAAVWSVIADRVRPQVRAGAGHSLGEFSAYMAAGAISPADAARLVRRRGELMFAAGEARPGAMAAILGTLHEPIESICAAALSAGAVVPANYNNDEQIVVSGEVAGVERAMELAKAAGAKRAVRLPVSGAFHSPLMAPAATGLATALATVAWQPALFPVYANVDAQPMQEPDSARQLLVQQLTAPVRWTSVVRALAEAHPGAVFVEVGTGNVLCGLIKRIVPGVEAIPCGTVAEVTSLLERVG
jgi:[acyl-carrier-protein] S-malonyltransferase